MLYPIGEYIHQNLSTTFTDTVQLIQELKETRFTGYMTIHYWAFEAVIVFDSGQIIQVYYKGDKDTRAGLEAYGTILEKITERDGSINVVKTDSELTIILAAVPYAKENPQKFVLNQENLVKIQNLLEEKSYSAIVNALDEKKDIELTLYFYEGNLLSLAGKKGNEILARSLDDLGKIIKLLKNEGIPAHIYYLDMSQSVNVLEDFSLQATLDRWAQFYGDLFTLILNFADDKVGKGEGKKLLQSVRLALADQYLFLDPFVDAVDFSEVPLKINEFVNIYEFINGMDLSALKILEKLREIKGKKFSTEELEKAITEIFNKYEDLMLQVPEGKRLYVKEFYGV